MDERGTYLVGEVGNKAHGRVGRDRDDDVVALRAGRLDPRRKAQFLQQITQVERGFPNGLRIVSGRIEIEDAEIGTLQVGNPRGPDVLRDRVLVGHPEQ